MTGIELFVALTSDYLASKGSPLSSAGGLAAGSLLETLFRKRASEAREILISELRLGAKTEYEIDPEEAVAIIFRFFRAATEGTARLNLGLLGSCIAEGASADRLHADLFMTWADILASLRREEIHLLAASRAVTARTLGIDAAWPETKRLMNVMFGYDGDETDAFAASLSRTGCLVPLTAWDGMYYKTTKIFDELSSLVDIDGVVGRYA